MIWKSHLECDNIFVLLLNFLNLTTDMHRQLRQLLHSEDILCFIHSSIKSVNHHFLNTELQIFTSLHSMCAWCLCLCGTSVLCIITQDKLVPNIVSHKATEMEYCKSVKCELSNDCNLNCYNLTERLFMVTDNYLC